MEGNHRFNPTFEEVETIIEGFPKAKPYAGTLAVYLCNVARGIFEGSASFETLCADLSAIPVSPIELSKKVNELYTGPKNEYRPENR